MLYKHIYKDGILKFIKFAKNVWNIDDSHLSQEDIALKGIQALAHFIKEIGLPTTLTDMGIIDKEMLKKVADSSNLTAGCCKRLSHAEIYDILVECL